MINSNKRNRRDFLQISGQVLGAAVAAPWIVPSSALGKDGSAAPSDRIGMGFIGLGTMGSGHLFGEAWTYLPGGFAARADVQVLALCDVLRDRRIQVQNRLHEFYAQRYGSGNYKSSEVYNDFRDVLARDDIDAVLIATPIHWHATMTVFAAKAGKDVYCEKPTAVTIHESKAMVKAVLENKRVFQAGTQQRSEYDGKFHRACELIRNGRIGQVKEIYAYRDGGGARWPDVTTMEYVPVPDNLDWDLWLGPAPKLPFQGRHDAHLFGFGGINWGQHHYDIVNWALDADRSGPVEISFKEDHAAYRFANGAMVYGRPYPGTNIGETGGGWYIGTEGKIGVDREHLVSEPESILEKPIGENDERLYESLSHSGNFLDCIKTRKRTICDVETAHRAASVMLLGGVALQLKRDLRWDPVQERFLGDDEANQLLSLPKRDPWKV